MTYGKRLSWGLALAAMVLAGANAQADIVTYATIGTFGGGTTPGTSTFTSGNVSIIYNNGAGVNVNVNPTTQVSFGTFSTTGTTATVAAPITSSFTLQIVQTAPVAGTGTFLGTLSGTLTIDASTAFVQFTGPLTLTIDGERYDIVSADNLTAGRVNINPRNTNNGQATIAGRITAVPEPTALALTVLGGSALVGLGYRNRRRATMDLEV